MQDRRGSAKLSKEWTAILSSSHTKEVKALDSRWQKWSDRHSVCGTYLVAVPNMRVSGGRCLTVTWNMVLFSKGEANTRAHGLNQAWITELMTLDFEKKKKKKVGPGSMLVRSDRRSSIDLPKNNNRGVIGIKGLCKRHNDHRPSEPSSLTLTPFPIACTFESHTSHGSTLWFPRCSWVETEHKWNAFSDTNSRLCRWSSG